MKIVLRSALVLVLCMGLDTAHASTLCTPNIIQDSVNLSPTCPQLGAPIIVAPGAKYAWGANDNGPEIDFDFNDDYGTLLFDAHTIPTLTVLGSLSAWTTQDFVSIAGISGAELLLKIASPDGLFFSGDPARNMDGLPHFWIQRYGAPEETPEPGTLLIAATGLLFVWGWRKHA